MFNINWKLRGMNKATLMGLICTTVALVYQILGIIGVTPPISENVVVEWVGVVMTLLVKLGIIVDPTTKGIGDSARAMDYEIPSADDGGLVEYDDDEDDEVDLDELIAVIREQAEEDDDEEEYEDPADDEVLPQ